MRSTEWALLGELLSSDACKVQTLQHLPCHCAVMEQPGEGCHHIIVTRHGDSLVVSELVYEGFDFLEAGSVGTHSKPPSSA